MPQPLTLEIWYLALGSPSGIVINVTDMDRAKQKLYKLRADAKDGDLEQLSIQTSPTTPNQLWIVKKDSK